VCGVLAAYAMQRMAFPLRDEFLTRADLALGFHWLDYVRWVDRHPWVQAVVRFAYDTIALQIALPVIVLSLSGRIADMRRYLLAFAIAFSVTIVISALMPAAGPIAYADRSTFDILRFTGATPIGHLMRLREAGPLLMDDFPGGIATFPSFHSTVAVLTPLALFSHRRIFVCLLVLNAAMLAGTISEGAHYLIDTLAGSGMAFVGYALARPILKAEDGWFVRRERAYSANPDGVQPAA
jgi:membrane-associated phospholipid phosphatase